MFDVAWPELLVIGVVAFMVIGPKDMPKVMHTLGRMARKARTFGQNLQANFDVLEEEVKESERGEGKK